jgi:hypothetical protein
LHVRNSTLEDSFNSLNQKLALFFQHSDSIYYWIEGFKGIKKLSTKSVSSYYHIDDFSFVYGTKFDTGIDEELQINKVTVKHSCVENEIIYREIFKETKRILQSHTYDISQNFLILLTKNIRNDDDFVY